MLSWLFGRRRSLFVWTLGSLPHRVYPTKEVVEKVKQLLKESGVGGDHIVLGPEVSVQRLDYEDSPQGIRGDETSVSCRDCHLCDDESEFHIHTGSVELYIDGEFTGHLDLDGETNTEVIKEMVLEDECVIKVAGVDIDDVDVIVTQTPVVIVTTKREPVSGSVSEPPC